MTRYASSLRKNQEVRARQTEALELLRTQHWIGSSSRGVFHLVQEDRVPSMNSSLMASDFGITGDNLDAVLSDVLWGPGRSYHDADTGET